MCLCVFYCPYHMFQLHKVQLYTTVIRRILDTTAPFSLIFRFIFISRSLLRCLLLLQKY